MSTSRLKKGDISIAEMLKISYDYYKKKDDKPWRAKLDVKSARITARRNMIYNPSKHKWEQSAREVKFEFVVKTDPISYDRNDSLKYHYYPVVFILRDFDAGLNSSFRSRVGSFKKWKKSNKKISEGKDKREKDRIRKENKEIQEKNIKDGIQADFLFGQMWIYRKYDLLWGPMTCLNQPPKITNPNFMPYFSKHEFWIIQNILIPILNTKTGIIKNKLFKDE